MRGMAQREETDSLVPSGSRPPERVLILGGTAFIGRTVTRKLHEEGYLLVFINRGRSYWNGENIAQAEYHRADRKAPEAFAACVASLTDREEATRGRSWLAVVDFSAYKPRDILASLKGLRGRYGMYIYISTDSVYEVSDSSLWRGLPSVSEDFAVRPKEKQRVSLLKKKDTYGHNKFAVEEILRKETHATGRPVACLRLADVIGPFDDTDRFWTYFLWTQVAGQHPVLVDPSGATQRMNLTFVEDVAAAVSRLLRSRLAEPRCGVQGRTTDLHASLSSSASVAASRDQTEATAAAKREEQESLFHAFNLVCSANPRVSRDNPPRSALSISNRINRRQSLWHGRAPNHGLAPNFECEVADLKRKK
ncbi:UNVERIFIED_CONTAM: NAD dependent epimerase/dehydratase family protein [Hammondia hammondi]|eukprot:XP_008882382.1 NAD dependent epimerase/dehydratase family protein [Hammondia hammondi]